MRTQRDGRLHHFRKVNFLLGNRPYSFTGENKRDRCYYHVSEGKRRSEPLEISTRAQVLVSSIRTGTVQLVQRPHESTERVYCSPMVFSGVQS